MNTFRDDLRREWIRQGLPGDPEEEVTLGPLSTDQFLTFCEILVEEGERPRDAGFTTLLGHRNLVATRQAPLLPDIEKELNDLFEIHGFGYRVDRGEVHSVISPLLEQETVGPALLLMHDEGWDQAEKSLRNALAYQRAGEVSDALTAANAAVEAALKACGLKGGTLGDLLKEFKKSQIVAGYADGVPEMVNTLANRLMAWRPQGSAHGRAPGATAPPPELTALAIHWAAAFIVYLADASRRSRP